MSIPAQWECMPVAGPDLHLIPGQKQKVFFFFKFLLPHWRRSLKVFVGNHWNVQFISGNNDITRAKVNTTFPVQLCSCMWLGSNKKCPQTFPNTHALSSNWIPKQLVRSSAWWWCVGCCLYSAAATGHLGVDSMICSRVQGCRIILGGMNATNNDEDLVFMSSWYVHWNLNGQYLYILVQQFVHCPHSTRIRSSGRDYSGIRKSDGNH